MQTTYRCQYQRPATNYYLLHILSKNPTVLVPLGNQTLATPSNLNSTRTLTTLLGFHLFTQLVATGISGLAGVHFTLRINLGEGHGTLSGTFVKHRELTPYEGDVSSIVVCTHQVASVVSMTRFIMRGIVRFIYLNKSYNVTRGMLPFPVTCYNW